MSVDKPEITLSLGYRSRRVGATDVYPGQVLEKLAVLPLEVLSLIPHWGNVGYPYGDIILTLYITVCLQGTSRKIVSLFQVFDQVRRYLRFRPEVFRGSLVPSTTVNKSNKISYIRLFDYLLYRID